MEIGESVFVWFKGGQDEDKIPCVPINDIPGSLTVSAQARNCDLTVVMDCKNIWDIHHIGYRMVQFQCSYVQL